jgi:hypothetical protein
MSENFVDLVSIPAAPADKSATAGSSWLTLLQFSLTSAVVLLLWGIGAILVLLGIFSLGVIAGQSRLTVMVMAVSLGACGLMLLPSVYTSFMRIRGEPLPESFQPLLNLHPLVPALLLIPVLGAGYLASQSAIAWLVIPVLHVLAVVLPVLFLLILALRKLPTGTPQRRSGVFGTGLILGPFLILFVEVVVLVGMIVVIGVYISSQPQLLKDLQALFSRLSSVQGDPDELMNLLAPFLANPWVILGTLFFISVLVPLIEEFFKPVGVWFLAGRGITPAAGFAAGALSGAGYAIFESLALSGGGEEWASLVTVRMGTAVIHIMTTALTGWALASVWREKRYLRLVVVYLAVVIVHGLWNGMTLMLFLNESVNNQLIDLDWNFLPVFGILGPFVLVSLTVGGLAVLVGMNRAFRREQITPVITE